jgi:hypothetical protein
VTGRVHWPGERSRPIFPVCARRGAESARGRKFLLDHHQQAWQTDGQGLPYAARGDIFVLKETGISARRHVRQIHGHQHPEYLRDAIQALG